MPTGRLYNTTIVEDLRLIRDLMNEAAEESIAEYIERENSIRRILGCPDKGTDEDEEIEV